LDVINISQVENLIGHVFRNKNFLNMALTHRSFSNLNNENYERLEFLGDSVLSFLISEYLYKAYLNEDEGVLSKTRAYIVSESSLCESIKELNISQFIRLGKSEQLNECVQVSILADIYESILAAIFLDSGMQESRNFVVKTLKDKLDETICNKNFSDNKTKLQEVIFAKFSKEVEYKIINESGPDHNKQFTAVVECDHKILGQGVGRSKKEAEQMAASEALSSTNFANF